MSKEEVRIAGKTDSKLLQRAIVSMTRVSNKRLRIDIAAIKEATELKMRMERM